MQDKKQQLEPDIGQRTESKSGKKYIKTVYCPLAYLTYMQRISYEMPVGRLTSWNQDCQRNINNLRYVDDTTLIVERVEELKSLWMRVKEQSENTGLKLNIQKIKIMASRSHHFMANRRGKSGNSDRW